MRECPSVTVLSYTEKILSLEKGKKIYQMHKKTNILVSTKSN